MSDDAVVRREMTEVAASADTLPRRAEQLLAVLRRVVPFEGAWLALADLHHSVYTTLAARISPTRSWRSSRAPHTSATSR
ncbi:hypothetical protein ACI79D_13355 [Geodermatophilus sp. SYSU D00708]